MLFLFAVIFVVCRGDVVIDTEINIILASNEKQEVDVDMNYGYIQSLNQTTFRADFYSGGGSVAALSCTGSAYQIGIGKYVIKKIVIKNLSQFDNHVRITSSKIIVSIPLLIFVSGMIITVIVLLSCLVIKTKAWKICCEKCYAGKGKSDTTIRLLPVINK
jgi:hypothetical protein